MNNIFGTHDDKTLAQLAEVAANAERVALMADGHLGYVMPIGGVAAYRNQVSVVGIGFDIGCGNCAIKTDKRLEDVTAGKITRTEADSNPHRLVKDAWLVDLARYIDDTISFGIGRKNTADDAPVDHPLFERPAWWIVPNTGSFRDDLKDKARRQLGTVGSGNHYVDVFVDEDGWIWVGVHFGSRGFGHTIATNFLAIGQGGTWGDRGKEQETLLDLDTQVGQDYWALMTLALDYATAGREWVARKVVSMMGWNEVDLVHNHHNAAWKEEHWSSKDGGYVECVVVRKGATPAFPGQRGFVGGSMGDDAVILEGTRPELQLPFDRVNLELWQRDALYSTVHGAGRVMSRTEAAGKRDRKTGQLKIDPTTGQPKNPGKVTPQMMQEWLAKKGVILKGGGLDESPHVYRRLPDVLAAQQGTITVLHTLRPVIVLMAGANEYDPYKD